MARAEAASASIRSDSIKGLAQSIAKPAYRRLLTAEPALRRAVPALIIAFLLTICVGTVVQILDHRRQAEHREHRVRPEDMPARQVPVPQAAASAIEAGIDDRAHHLVDVVGFAGAPGLPMEGKAKDQQHE